MRILFLGFAIPDDLFELVLRTDVSLPVQTQKFGWALIRAVRSAGMDLEIVSAEPVRDFPHNTRLMIRGLPFTDEERVRGHTVSFINVTGLKHVSRYLSSLYLIDRLRLAEHVDAILIHGLHSPFLWVGLRLGRRIGVPVVVVLTDAPSLRTKYDNQFSGWLKTIDRRLILRALRSMDGAITLAPRLGSDLAPGVPTLAMEGIAPDLSIERAGRECVTARRVVYAGGLHEAYGVMDLIGAVDLSEGDWVLEIVGRGPAEWQVRAASERSARIQFSGSVPPREMHEVYGRADILVNPRPPTGELAQLSFPSKLLEYMASGVPVVTTALPLLPEDYEDHVILARSGPAGLADAIDHLAGLTPEAREAIGKEARNFIQRTRGADVQGRRMRRFIESLTRTVQDPRRPN